MLDDNMSDDNSNNTNKNYIFNSKLAFLLIAVGSAALVVTIYHCLTTTWRNRHNLRRPRGSPNPQGDVAESGAEEEVRMSSYDETSTAQLFPAHKYQKGMEMGWGDEDLTCAICLSEFEEGEKTKTLPICLHSYHAECIDMWLFSHSNCPMCRTDATPSPSPRVELGLGGGGGGSGSGASTYSRSDHMLEIY